MEKQIQNTIEYIYIEQITSPAIKCNIYVLKHHLEQ